MSGIVVALVVALAGAGLVPASASMTRSEAKLLRVMNAKRTSHGVKRLHPRAGLHRKAHSWAMYLRRHDAFYHQSLSAGVSENIGWVTCRQRWARVLVRMWLHSPAHRANLLDRSARYVGVGVSRGPFQGRRCVRMAVTDFR